MPRLTEDQSKRIRALAFQVSYLVYTSARDGAIRPWEERYEYQKSINGGYISSHDIEGWDHAMNMSGGRE